MNSKFGRRVISALCLGITFCLVATATLANGDPYVNPGVHIISIRWGKAYALDVSEDSQAVATGLAKQAQAGIEEAAAPKIES